MHMYDLGRLQPLCIIHIFDNLVVLPETELPLLNKCSDFSLKISCVSFQGWTGARLDQVQTV